MNLYPQYLNYNLVKVTLYTNNGTYVISNVQKKGIPSEKCEAHLESLNIETSVVGQNNPTDCGSSGTVTVIDYKEAVFDTLKSNLEKYISNSRDVKFLPEIEIEVFCYTGYRKWFGQITDWDLQFVGTTPSLSISWSSIVQQNYKEDKDGGSKFPYRGEQKTASEWLDFLSKSEAFSPKVTLALPDGKSLNDVCFMGPDGNASRDNKMCLALDGLKTTGNQQLDAYNYIIERSKIGDNLLSGRIDASGGSNNDKSYKYIIEYRDQQNNNKTTENGNIQTRLVFVQNGSYKYYKARQDGLVVVPVTSFSYNTKMSNLVLESRVLHNPNGSIVQNFGNQSAITVDSSAAATAIQSGSSSDPQNSAIAVTFECYNVINFSQHNVSEPVLYEVYNENGKKHIISGKGIVNSCKFSLQGGVIKADVSCTELYNKTDVSSSGESNVKNSDGVSAGSTVTVESPADDKLNNSLYENKSSKLIPLTKDRTEICIKSGKFASHVSKFLNNYALLKGTSRLLDVAFVQELIDDGNIGLLSLLISVSNYGIKNYKPSWGEDPVLSYKGFKTPYQASPTGKSPISPFDNKKPAGGLGIAHWDDANLYNIYTTIGFDAGLYNDKKSLDELSKLIIADRKKPSDPLVTVSWDKFIYNGLNRIRPVFSVKKPTMRVFDDKLKSNQLWLDFANEAVYRVDGSGNYVFQPYLFKLWVDKFWKPTITELSKIEASHRFSGGQLPSLQDAVRISRAANSGTSYIKKLSGLPAEDQIRLYCQDRHPDRRKKQMLFCARANKILESELL